MSALSEGLTDSIAHEAANCTCDRLPLNARRAAARAILDATGVMAAASAVSDDVQPFLRYAASAGTGGRASILGVGQCVDASMAAFANGAMAHALDYEDVFDRAPCHPNASSVPTGFALAQQLSGVHGREFIAAIAAGCEIACRMSLGVGDSPARGGWYPPMLLSAVAATVAGAKLLRNEPGNILDALSLLLMQLGAPGAIRHAADSPLRATREAFPARAATTACLLAADGVRGFDDPLGGPGGFLDLYAGGACDRRALLDDWGAHWLIENLSFKPWPACRGTHGCIGMALELYRDHGIDWRDISAIDVGVGPMQAMLAEPRERKRAPATVIDAKFSLPFTVAVAFIRGQVTLDDFTESALRDANLRALAERVTVRVLDDWGTDRAAAGEMRVTLASGKSFERAVTEAAGHPLAPMSDAALVAKFLDCCARAARPPEAGRAATVAERILNLPNEPDVGALIAELFPRLPS